MLSLVLVGCGSDSTSATKVSPVSAPTPTQSARTLSFKINAAPGYSKSGTARFDITTFGYTVTVTVKGLTPGSRHIINMHGGTCANQEISETSLRSIDDATVDATGTLTSVTNWARIWSVPTAGRILTVHGNDGTDGQLAHIACADLTN